MQYATKSSECEDQHKGQALQIYNQAPHDTATWLYRLIFDEEVLGHDENELIVAVPSGERTECENTKFSTTSGRDQLVQPFNISGHSRESSSALARAQPTEPRETVDRLLTQWTNLSIEEVIETKFLSPTSNLGLEHKNIVTPEQPKVRPGMASTDEGTTSDTQPVDRVSDNKQGSSSWGSPVSLSRGSVICPKDWPNKADLASVARKQKYPTGSIYSELYQKLRQALRPFDEEFAWQTCRDITVHTLADYNEEEPTSTFIPPVFPVFLLPQPPEPPQSSPPPSPPSDITHLPGQRIEIHDGRFHTSRREPPPPPPPRPAHQSSGTGFIDITGQRIGINDGRFYTSRREPPPPPPPPPAHQSSGTGFIDITGQGSVIHEGWR
jgi:hypothetical protein